MATCPNFNDPKYKFLESKLGELEAYKYWSQHSGDISHILTNEETKALLDHAKSLKANLSVDIYGIMMNKDPKQFLKDMADQLNSSESEAINARKILGPELTSIAITLRANENLTPKSINATMKIIGALKEDKFKSLFNRFFKSNPDKFYSELNQFAPKAQIELLKNLVKQSNPTSVNDLITSLLADVSYAVEINTATHGIGNVFRDPETGKESTDEYQRPTQHYSNMTVPGGTNYTENEIRTPDITPVRQGHAEFSTENGIGWFRSDDKAEGGKFSRYNDNILTPDDWANEEPEDGISDTRGGILTKTRRILEIQSDLFQKERSSERLVNSKIGYDSTSGETRPVMLDSKDRENNFLQLLNKDNNWVNFFVKSIIQDSARKGYEEVLFPSGSTAAKVEGHETLEQFLDTSQRNINELGRRLKPGGLENWFNSRVESIEAAAKSNRESAKEPKLSDTTDHFIKPATIHSPYRFVRIRQNYYNEAHSNDTLTGDSYRGWVLYEYTVGQGNKISKLTDSEAQDLLYKDYSSREEIHRREADKQELNAATMRLGKEDVLKEEREKIRREIDHIKQEMEDARNGRTQLSSVANFYENTIQNILNKQKFEPERIKDEYGNEWFKVNLSNNLANDTIRFEKSKPFLQNALVGKLQSEGKLGKRISQGQYEVIDPEASNPLDLQRRAYEIQEQLNRQLGKEVVTTSVTPNGVTILIDPKTNAIIDSLDRQDINTYKKFLLDNLYTNKNNPTPNELLNNAAVLAQKLGRDDLTNISRLLYKYLYKNPYLTARVINKMDEPDAKAYYSSTSNGVTFARDSIGTSTLEYEAATVIHELLHGLTNQVWVKTKNSVTLSPEEQQFKHVVDTYYNYFKGLNGADKSLHGFKNSEEFLVASLLNSPFKDHLKKIVQGSKENVFLKFMKDILKSFLKLFGINPQDKDIDKIDPSKVENDLFNSLSDFLEKMDPVRRYNYLKEQGNSYGLSFEVTAEGDYESERQKMKEKFTPELKETLKKTLEKSILSIKSFGSTIRSRLPESQEGFKTIFNQLKKLEDANHSLDQIEFFFDFTSEIAAIMNVANDKVTKLGTDQVINDPDFKLKEYESIVSAIRNFDPIVNDIERVKVNMESAGLGEYTKDINDMLLKRSRIEQVYSMGIFPLVTSKMVDILSPATKKALEISNDKMTKLNRSLEIATKNNVKGRIKQLQSEITKENKFVQDQITLDSDKVENWLRGEMGDSHLLTTWAMAGVSNGNPIVSSLSKYIRDNVAEIAPAVLNLQNSLQSQMDSYQKNTGISHNNTTNFNRPLIQTHKEITGKDDKGNYVYKDVLNIMHQFNNGHIVEFQKFTRDLVDLYEQKRNIENTPDVDEDKLDKVTKKIGEIKNNRRQFIEDYMEQQYKPEVHKALDMLHEDLGGYTAWDYMGPVLSRIEDLNDRIDQESDESVISDLYTQLDDQNFELARLSSLYEKSPDSREYKVAEQLKARTKELSKYSTYELTEKARQHFESEKARVARKLDKGEISKDRYERWLEDNTITELTQAYWNEKKSLIDELNDIATKLGKEVDKDKSEEMSKLYSDIEDIVRVYRDSSGIINGQEMTEKELKDVKATEEKLEKIKDNIATIMGLTKTEKMELANLYNELSDITEKVLLGNTSYMLDEERLRVSNRIKEIQDRKKKLDKKLLEQYFTIIKRLSALDKTQNTKYYMDEVEKRKEDAKWSVDISKIPTKFFYDGSTFQKNKDAWFETNTKGAIPRESSYVEDKYREREGQIKFAGSEWWKNNHIERIKFIPNDEYDPSNANDVSGSWTTGEDPIYAWRQTRPQNEKYISEGQPSIKYKKRIIKDEYKNPNYRESITGDVQPKVRGAKDDRFINKDFNKLDKPTADYLKFLTDTYLQAQDSIPKALRPGYGLPSIRKSELERFFSEPVNVSTSELFSRLGQMLKGVKDKTKKNEQDKDILFGYNDDYNGIVPVKFIGQISADDQTVDLAKSILLFTVEAKKREQLMKSLPFANAVRNIANNSDYRPVKTKNGKIESIRRKFLPKGTELAKRSEVSHTAHQINEIIKTEIYGENQKDQPGTKIVDSALNLGASVLLGFNFVSSVQNYANAFTQSIMETEGKNSGNFTVKNFFNAQKIYYAHVNELMSDLGKYGNKSYINQFFDYFGGINFKLYSKNNKNLANGKLREFVSNMSIPNTITEHMLNYHMAIAIALNYRVKSGDTTIPIFEAFTLRDRKLQLKDGVQLTEDDRKELISRLNSSARRINGEYGDKILIDKYILGRMALFMNRYVIPFVVKRYGPRKFDIQDGITDEGYWRLLGKLIYKDLKSTWFLPPIISGWKYYTKEEKTAVIKASTEFGFTVMFYLMINALGGGDNKHLKDNSILTNNLIYALKGIQQQNESFMPIPGIGFDDIIRKVQNPFPIFGKVKNLASLLNDGTKTIAYEMGIPGVDKSDVYYSQNQGWHHRGDFKFMSDLDKLIGLQRLYQYMNPDQAIKNQDAMSRIK